VLTNGILNGPCRTQSFAQLTELEKELLLIDQYAHRFTRGHGVLIGPPVDFEGFRGPERGQWPVRFSSIVAEMIRWGRLVGYAIG